MSLDVPRLSVETLVDKPTRRLSLTRKLVMLSVFCFAQFLDAFNNAALFPAIPALEGFMDIKQSQSAWIISAFQLTFASLLLIVCLSFLTCESRHDLTRASRADG